MSSLFRLNSSDFAKGAFSAVIAALVMTLAGAVSQPGFDVFSLDWASLLNTAINSGVAAFVGYIGKNFLSDSEGRPLGFGK